MATSATDWQTPEPSLLDSPDLPDRGLISSRPRMPVGPTGCWLALPRLRGRGGWDSGLRQEGGVARESGPRPNISAEVTGDRGEKKRAQKVSFTHLSVVVVVQRFRLITRCFSGLI